MKEFLALHNRTVTRTEIEAVIEAAKEQQNTAVIYRLSRILNAHPSTNSFVINIRQYPETQGLSGAQHTSDYHEALDENGRLRKGYKFVNGKIIPAQPSQPSQDDEITFLAAAGIDYLPEAPDDEPQGLGKPVPAADIYKMVTDKVISMFKNAKISDYKRAWKDDQFFIPLNYDSKKPYRGVNRLLLEENIGIIGSFANPYFLTFKQIKKHGGKLKKGSKGYEVIYYSFIYSVPAAPNRKALKTTEVADVIAHLQKYNLPESVVKRVPLLRYYRVFNGKDVEGIQFNLQEVKIGRAVPDSASENEAAQLIVENYPNPPAIKHGGNKAYYERIQDLVRMPKVEQFDSVNDYYRTLFHELTHSTRHENRLNREKISFRFGDTGYAKEELVAEFGAVFLSAWAGILWYNNKNHAAYLKGWNNVIEEAENDNKFIMQAAAAAQKATDHILNLDANGQPAFLSQYEKPKKKEEPKSPTPPTAPQPTKKAPEKAVTALNFSDVKANRQMIESYRNSSTRKINLLKTDMIGTQFHLSMFEKYMAIDDIAALYGKGRKEEAQKDYAFVKERIERAFNHHLRAAKEYNTIEQCTERFIELLPDLLAKGGQWLEAKALNKKTAPAKGKFTKTYKQTSDEIASIAVGANGNSSSKKNTEKADNTDKKYKFIAFYNSYGRINGIYSYQNLTINEFYLKNTFDDGIKVYAPLRSLEKIEEAKRIIEKQYIEGKDFICLKFESKKREEYYSLLIHSNEKPKPQDPKAKKNTKVAQYTGVKTIPLSDLYTDEKRFQNRKKLNEEIVDNIVKNFKPTDLDPLVVWYDKKQDKTFVLAGHHRFEALKRLKHKTVPVKYANEDYPTEADAIRYAKEISNANRTLEEPYERAAIYRKYREEGYSEKDINEKAALEGKNRSYILNLSWLNPKGATMSTLVQFSQTQSKADKNEAERIADWIGQARRNAPELTDAHEKEMFDFLTNKEASKRTTNKAKFLEYVRACYNPFEPTEPLNLARIKYQSEGEKQYDEEVEELKSNINKLQGNITDIKDRFINPNNPQYIKPTAPDYLAIKQIADNKIAEYNTQIQYYQKKLLEVYQNKKNYIKPTGQMALFGKYPETDTQRFKKMKVKSYNIGTKISKTSHTTESEKSQSAFVKRSLATNNKAKIVPKSLNLPDTPNLAAKMAALQTRNWESFKIANPQMQRFLGDVELKESESTVITIGGGAGSGKTRFAFQFINALAQNYKVGHASLEEHPDSKLYYDKVKQYLDPTAMANVEAPEIKNLQQLDELIQRNEVIVIDSFAKLRELDSRFMLDRDLRKKYNSKLFLLIYQLTGDGKMRGGSESEFDGDIILLTHVSPDYRENYIYPKKNRYNALPATQLRYSTYYQQMLPTEDTLSGTKEASNNTYEIIY